MCSTHGYRYNDDDLLGDTVTSDNEKSYVRGYEIRKSSVSGDRSATFYILLLFRYLRLSIFFRHKPTQWNKISSAHRAIEQNGFDQRPEDSVPRAAVRSAHHRQGSTSVPGTETAETRTVPVQREGLHVVQ